MCSKRRTLPRACGRACAPVLHNNKVGQSLGILRSIVDVDILVAIAACAGASKMFTFPGGRALILVLVAPVSCDAVAAAVDGDALGDATVVACRDLQHQARANLAGLPLPSSAPRCLGRSFQRLNDAPPTSNLQPAQHHTLAFHLSWDSVGYETNFFNFLILRFLLHRSFSPASFPFAVA